MVAQHVRRREDALRHVALAEVGGGVAGVVQPLRERGGARQVEQHTMVVVHRGARRVQAGLDRRARRDAHG